MMDCSSLQLKLISCRDLKAFNLFHKLSVYAVVSIFNDDLKEQEQDGGHQPQKTPVDEQGGRHPEWNHVMQFDLCAPRLFLKFKLRCLGVIFGKRTIGQVDVRVQDLIDEFNGSVRFVSYQIRTSDGKPNGVLNFSYEVKGKAELPNRISVSAEEENRSSLHGDQQSQRRRLYPSLDDIRSPLPLNLNMTKWQHPTQESYMQLPAYVVGYGVCPSPSVQTPAVPHCYTAGAGAGYGCSVGAGWANYSRAV